MTSEENLTAHKIYWRFSWIYWSLSLLPSLLKTNTGNKFYLRFSSPSTTCNSLQDKLRVLRLFRPPSPWILVMWFDDKSRYLRCWSRSRFSITEMLLQCRFIEINPGSRWKSNRLFICESIKQISFGKVVETTSSLSVAIVVLLIHSQIFSRVKYFSHYIQPYRHPLIIHLY